MNKRSQRLLGEIEAGALDQKTPISDLLRKVIALGGQAGSAELRDWATRELRGYGPDDELPPYWKIGAPLQLDMSNMRYVLTGQTISPWELPEVAHDKITNDLDLRHGIGEIEQMARRCEPGYAVKLSPPLSQEVVVLMNRQEHLNGHVHRLYWGVSPVTLDGVVEQVRTTLTVMVAEIRDTMPDHAEIPSAEVATNAITFAVTGKRNKVNFTAGQGKAKVPAPAPEEEHPRRWLRITGTVIAAILGILRLRRRGLRPHAGAGLEVLKLPDRPQTYPGRVDQGQVWTALRCDVAGSAATRTYLASTVTGVDAQDGLP